MLVGKSPAEDDVEDTWAFCSECGTARRLPPGVTVDDDSDVPWYCWYLPAGNKYRDCSVPQEEVHATEVRARIIDQSLASLASGLALFGSNSRPVVPNFPSPFELLRCAAQRTVGVKNAGKKFTANGPEPAKKQAKR